MRDPDAAIRFEADRVVRMLHQPLPEEHFLHSVLAQRWVNAGVLVAFEHVGSREISAERLPFVTYPVDWCDAQLFAAAQLTLDLQREAIASGFDLKDASAWNVLFAGTRPVFLAGRRQSCI